MSATSAELEKWISEAPNVIKFGWVQASQLPQSEPTRTELDALATHAPIVAWPLFPEDQIFGYKNLHIVCLFSATSLHPFLHIAYSGAITDDPAFSEFEVQDITAAFRARFEECGLELAPSWSSFVQRCQQDESNFSPPGELWHEFMGRAQARQSDVENLDEGRKRKRPAGSDQQHRKKKSQTTVSGTDLTATDDDDVEMKALDTPDEKPRLSYEVYKFSLSDAASLTFLRRFRIFLLFYIDGARYIDDSDTRWEVYCVFQVGQQAGATQHVRSFAGFATCYPYRYLNLNWQYPESEGPADITEKAKNENDNWRTRIRISQFLVLPPWQGKGVGSSFYRALYNDFLAREDVSEIAIEEPNDTMTDLRDHCDYTLLRSNDAFTRLSVELFWNGGHIRCVRRRYLAEQDPPLDQVLADGNLNDETVGPMMDRSKDRDLDDGTVGPMMERSKDGEIKNSTIESEKRKFDVEVEAIGRKWKITKVKMAMSMSPVI
ncbi:acyl-CoA N-acyltransferase [Gonapodya prolifera JEL478]|uniref:Histone acetyltransferase type B catalytic subunit n=1 Tax=Gonapodya prolifera (strain JEL478) TaxID=1344416 RepID=A0A139AXL8_GONPJ|nr:acyl-CoA N-acyltransferase [Gonapodya prolifera JEL478]|eukprot:KXS21195.1 acyl-CoA N-acyltransferase [Gonapodya prolifera JEL478]